MFRWLTSWRRRRQQAKRNIFEYHDGRGRRWADPVLVWSKIEEAVGEDWPQALRFLTSPTPHSDPRLDNTRLLAESRRQQTQAVEKIAAAVSTAFEIPPLGTDENGKPVGLTQPERVALAIRFLNYMGGLAESAAPFAASPKPTA